jgi:GNAT superfamily N-acetyltransferase
MGEGETARRVVDLDEVHFRRASEADLPAIIALLADDVLGATREGSAEPDGEHYRRAFAAIDADPAHLLLVADLAGEPVGVLQLSFLPSLTHHGGVRAHVEGVRVASSMRGSGLGQRMMEHVIELARARDARMVQLMTDQRRDDARRFYERCGFTATHHGMKLHLSRITPTSGPGTR